MWITFHTYKHSPTRMIYICLCSTLGIILMLFSYLLPSFIFILLKQLWLMGWRLCWSCFTFCHIHHIISVWNLVNESHYSLLWHLLLVSQITYLYPRDHLLMTRQAHYRLTDLFILVSSAGDISPHQLALASSGSGLARHPNCSLKIPHSSRILQDASH